jgi:predicted double-glycine peptidase
MDAAPEWIRPVKLVALSIVISAAATLTLSPQTGLAQAPSPVRSLYEQRQEKVFLQQYDLSCGAAALATVLNYQHGEPVNERQVAIGLISRHLYLANPDILRRREGFSLLDMNRYVRRLGYDGEAAGRLSFEDLVARAPAIVPVSLYGYSHFVVFRGVLGSNVLLADPAFGNRTLGAQRFIDAWIAYEAFGHVAFTVHRRDTLTPPDRLSPSAADFPILMPATRN